MVKQFDIYKPMKVIFLPDREKKYEKIKIGGVFRIWQGERYEVFESEPKTINLIKKVNV